MQEFQRKIAAVALTLSGLVTGQGCSKEPVRPETTAQTSDRWNFDTSLDFVLGREGKLSTNQNDRGNKGGNVTMCGVTQATYDEYRESHNLWKRSVARITEGEIRGVYKELFWDKVKCDRIPDSEMKLILFDSAVNHGTGGAVVILQRALGGLQDDGVFGSKTEAALSEVTDFEKLKTRFISERHDFYHDIVRRQPTQKQFLKGWIARLEHLKGALNEDPVVRVDIRDEPALPRFETRRYAVQKGDTLWSIAQRELQNSQRWSDIAMINGLDPKNPAITPGQEILLPKRSER